MKKTTLLFWFLIAVTSIRAQADAALNSAWSGYKKTVGIALRLNNGAEYLRNDHGIGGSPFFLSDSLFTGAVQYDQVWYRNISVQYDLSKDLLILGRPVDPKSIVPPPQLIQSFEIAGHHFIRLDRDSTMPSFMISGFYELLYEGRLTVLARRQKITHRSVSGDPRLEYKTYDDYFVRLNTQYFQVKNAGDFPRLITDKAADLKKFIRENKRLNRNDKEKVMIAAANYVEAL